MYSKEYIVQITHHYFQNCIQFVLLNKLVIDILWQRRIVWDQQMMHILQTFQEIPHLEMWHVVKVTTYTVFPFPSDVWASRNYQNLFLSSPITHFNRHPSASQNPVFIRTMFFQIMTLLSNFQHLIKKKKKGLIEVTLLVGRTVQPQEVGLPEK